MASINTISSKVKPLDLPEATKNNYTNDALKIIEKLKFLIAVQALTGLNRFYLFKFNKVVLFLTYVYVVLLNAIIVLMFWTNEPLANGVVAVRNFTCFEYTILACLASFSKRKKLKNLFENISSLDKTLKIDGHIDIICSNRRIIIWVLSSLICNLIEFNGISLLDDVATGLPFLFCLYILAVAHDCEQIFFFTLLRTLYLRLLVVKGHIQKSYKIDEESTKKKQNKFEKLSNNVQLDTIGLHEAYEMLHKCSEKLNAVMSFSMLIVLFASGLATTVLLKMLVKIIQTSDSLDPKVISIVCFYLIARCVKYTALVIVPCYYSSITATEVSIIRTTLHDAVNTLPFDKLQRRKVKAFYLMTKENGFVYALAGVIRLNMSLPLSYISLCTTYLVIIIQFSKFLD